MLATWAKLLGVAVGLVSASAVVAWWTSSDRQFVGKVGGWKQFKLFTLPRWPHDLEWLAAEKLQLNR